MTTDLPATAYGAEEGFRRAMAAANRKRVRSLSATVSCVVIALTVSGGVATSQQASSDRLRMTTTVPSEPPGIGARALPRTTPPAPGAGLGFAGPGYAPAAVGPVTPAGPAAPSGRGGSASYAAQSGEMQQSKHASPAACGTPNGSSSWCFLGSPQISRNPKRWNLSATVCSSAFPFAPAMSFPTSAEIDFAVVDASGRKVWSWLEDHPSRPTPHTLNFNTATNCVQWSTTWTGRQRDWKRPVPGKYTFVVTPLASSPGLPVRTMTFDLR